MTRLFAATRRYPVVAMTLLVAVIGGALALTGNELAAQWLISGFALIVAATQAWDMIKNLISGQWGIDALAIMAIIATVAVGEYWASLVICLMLSGGEALEDYAQGRAQRELKALLARSPQSAHRLINEAGEIEEIDVSAVAVGDRLLVRPSEVVPVDGELESDDGSFDESSLSGESLPVERVRGDALLSGSLNGMAAVIMTATAVAADSQYQRIVALVTDAAESKAPLVRLADRYAVPFTVVSLLIAGIAWLLSGDPVRFAEVLVVATPCPLLIAAPVAFLGGMSRASRFGIIVKSGGTLEQLSRARTVAFDKTGTLTYGNPSVVDIRPTGAFSEDELFALVASAETYSSHVLATAIVEDANARGLTVSSAVNAREEATNGVIAQIGEHGVVVGKFKFVQERASDAETTPISSGEMSVYVAVDGRFAGAIVLSDRLRSNAAATLSAFSALGITRFLMLTGDASETARDVAQELGVEEFHAELLPEDKVDLLKVISERPVVMVGDGVNDAPVLAAADVGIAMGAKGSTAASESADVVIVLDDISKTADAMAIGKRTMRVALQSIWLGIALSLGLMVFAAFGFLPAIIGAAMQEVVDLATILNALRALGGPQLGSSPKPKSKPKSKRNPSDPATRMVTIR